jgi:hypothetical protein
MKRYQITLAAWLAIVVTYGGTDASSVQQAQRAQILAGS